MLVNLQRILPSTEDYPREQIGCAEIHTFIFHCFFLVLGADIIAYGYHVSLSSSQAFDVHSSVCSLCGWQWDKLGFQLFLRGLRCVPLPPASAALTPPRMELIFAPNVFFSRTGTSAVGKLILSAFRSYSDFKDFRI